MIDSTDVLDALRAHGTVQWARISIGRDPLDSLVRVPMISWRYADRRDFLRERILLAVGSFTGNVEWRAELSGKNWVLLPERLDREFKRAPAGYTGVLSDLKHSDQTFCLRATEDLEILLDKIKRIESA
ncbi:hypothetical protein ACIBO2_45925 [Nonomuraea sp. NPDC050022]|uniref:hypothetical protein n=1 Tax=unclassified Nonomuraea TaxID=2593643 RepID=UPI0034045070